MKRDARPWLFVISALCIALDRITKLWVNKNVFMGQGIVVIQHVFRITHVLNTGAAFSLFDDAHSQQLVRLGLIAFSILAVVLIAGLLLRMGKDWTPATVGLALILGGAIGNLYDRIFLHYVIDFLEVMIVHYHWPDFNIADSCICVGAVLLILEILWPRKSQVKEVA